ncbi:hypothetical protein FH972_027086 [Carpinus fangiana]|uniref:Uncharacterized protein n=1 Tax=Carpinus fangiana TaxID=176857 RepID=A0A5N6L699_9ROSI|nr:hypothetical protein FH972_027086 [Carpinus fangiana]
MSVVALTLTSIKEWNRRHDKYVTRPGSKATNAHSVSTSGNITKSASDSWFNSEPDDYELRHERSGLVSAATAWASSERTRAWSAGCLGVGIRSTLKERLATHQSWMRWQSVWFGMSMKSVKRAKNHALQKVAQMKDVVVDAGETIIHYVGEKVVGAKDSTLETGKHVVEHAEKAAVGLKDKATVAGCTAAHYSCKKAMEGTKAVASAVKGATEYAGHKAAEIVSKPLFATKDVAASTGESAKEYTARNLLDSLYLNKKIFNHNYDLLGVGVGGQIQGLLGVCVQEEKMAGALLWVVEAESLMVMKMV